MGSINCNLGMKSNGSAKNKDKHHSHVRDFDYLTEIQIIFNNGLCLWAPRYHNIFHILHVRCKQILLMKQQLCPDY